MYRSFLKKIFCLIVAILFLLLHQTDAFSQNYASPIGWHHSIFEARVAALGQSTAALNNGSSYQMNPAIPFENGVLSASTFLFSTTAFDSPPDGANLYSPAISFSHGKFSYSAMIDYTSFSIPSGFNFEGGNYSNKHIRFQTGYQINDKLFVGAGILHSSYSSPVFGNDEYGGDATAWGIDLGAFYRNQFESGNFLFKPQIGLSLNDISSGFDYETSMMNPTNLPGQIRLGLGLDISSKSVHLNQSIFGGGIYSGFSKYLARWEMDGEPSQITTPGGFEALFTTWNSFEIFTGSEIEEISLGQQISASLGFEFHFLETLYLRYGLIGGSDRWIRPQHGLGAEADFYYISLAVTHLNYHSTDGWGPQDDSTYIQATFRLPIDGNPRDTLLSRLLSR